jgi:hypothetical protein
MWPVSRYVPKEASTIKPATASKLYPSLIFVNYALSPQQWSFNPSLLFVSIDGAHPSGVSYVILRWGKALHNY